MGSFGVGRDVAPRLISRDVVICRDWSSNQRFSTYSSK